MSYHAVPENAQLPIEVRLSGMVTEVKPLQPENAQPPIEATLSGMVTEVRPVQPENAESPIDITVLDMFTVARVSQLLNKSLVILLPVTVKCETGFPLKASLTTPVRFPGKVTDARLAHPPKALEGIELIDVGMVTDVKRRQSTKALFPIDVTEFGMITDANVKHPANA